MLPSFICMQLNTQRSWDKSLLGMLELKVSTKMHHNKLKTMMQVVRYLINVSVCLKKGATEPCCCLVFQWDFLKSYPSQLLLWTGFSCGLKYCEAYFKVCSKFSSNLLLSMREGETVFFLTAGTLCNDLRHDCSLCWPTDPRSVVIIIYNMWLYHHYTLHIWILAALLAEATERDDNLSTLQCSNTSSNNGFHSYQ